MTFSESILYGSQGEPNQPAGDGPLMDHHQQVDLVLLDFCKAFDTVPHHRLLSKLSSYRICTRPILGFLNSWKKTTGSYEWYNIYVDGYQSNLASHKGLF